MQEDVEVRPEPKNPAFKEVFFELSKCGRFGAIMSGKDVLRWIASREKGVTFAREASVHECILSHSDADKVIQQILDAPCIASREDHVDFYVRTSVDELNKNLEAYHGVRRNMFNFAEKVDESLCQRILAERPAYN